MRTYTVCQYEKDSLFVQGSFVRTDANALATVGRQDSGHKGSNDSMIPVRSFSMRARSHRRRLHGQCFLRQGSGVDPCI